MQVLYCHACKFPIPLNRPRLTEGYWYATCGECLFDHQLEPVSTNVFLPLRFRVASVVPCATLCAAPGSYLTCDKLPSS